VKWTVYKMRSHLPSAKPWWAFGPQSAQFVTWRQAYDYARAQAERQER